MTALKEITLALVLCFAIVGAGSGLFTAERFAQWERSVYLAVWRMMK